MKFLLNQYNDFIVEIFSIYHFLLILLTFLFVILIINNKELFINIKNKEKRKLQILLAFILIINWIIRRGSFIYYGVYNWQYHLDINFCNFTNILFLIYCLTNNKKIYNISFYMSFIGPLIAIIIPSVNLSPLNYSFYSYIIIHHLIFIFNIMFMYIENIKFNEKEYNKTIIFLIIYFSIIKIFNLVLKTTYNNATSFVNENLNINFILNNQILTAIIYILIIFILLNVGKLFLRIFNEKN